MVAAPAAAQERALSAPGGGPRDRVRCARCADAGAASAGSVVRVRGRPMADVRWVVFLAGPGPRRRRRGDGAADLAAVADGPGAGGRRLGAPAAAQPRRLAGRAERGDGGDRRRSGPVVAAASRPGRARPRHHRRDRRPRRPLQGLLRGRARRDAALRRHRAAGRSRWRSSSCGAAAGRSRAGRRARCRPGAEQVVAWDGTVDGAAAPAGPLRVPRRARSAAVAAQTAERPEVVDSFRFLDHKFPVRGAHDFGGANARLRHRPRRPQPPGPRRLRRVRDARSSPRAAGSSSSRRGTGTRATTSSCAGDGNGVDYAYMHLAAPASVDARRPGADRAADRRRRRHRQRPRLPPALRDCGRGRGGTRAAARSTRCRR